MSTRSAIVRVARLPMRCLSSFSRPGVVKAAQISQPAIPPRSRQNSHGSRVAARLGQVQIVISSFCGTRRVSMISFFEKCIFPHFWFCRFSRA